jgi:hypothetical protein
MITPSVLYETLYKMGSQIGLDYGAESGQGAAFYVADRKGRLVRVFCDGPGEA